MHTNESFSKLGSTLRFCGKLINLVPQALTQCCNNCVYLDGYYYQFSEYQRYNGDNYYGVRLVEDRWENAPTQIDAAMRKADGEFSRLLLL